MVSDPMSKEAIVVLQWFGDIMLSSSFNGGAFETMAGTTEVVVVAYEPAAGGELLSRGRMLEGGPVSTVMYMVVSS